MSHLLPLLALVCGLAYVRSRQEFKLYSLTAGTHAQKIDPVYLFLRVGRYSFQSRRRVTLQGGVLSSRQSGLMPWWKKLWLSYCASREAWLMLSTPVVSTSAYSKSGATQPEATAGRERS